MSSHENATPHIASYLILRDLGKIAFVLRANTNWMNNFYGLPSGKVEKGESYKQACLREAKEEVGIDVVVEDLDFIHVMHRREPGPVANEWVDLYFAASRWKGEPFNAEPDMHSELAWFDPRNLPENVIPAVALAITKIEAGEKYSEYGFAS